MTSVKIHLLNLIGSLLMLTGCIDKYPEHPHYSLSARQTSYSEIKEGSDSISLYGITLDLKPKSDTLHPIYLMQCSWGADNAVTNDLSWYSGYHNCDANFMWIHKVNSDQVLQLKTVATNRKLFDDSISSEFRIGIIIIDTLDYQFSNYFHDDREIQEMKFKQFNSEPTRVVWSNVIELQKMDNKIDHSGNLMIK